MKTKTGIDEVSFNKIINLFSLHPSLTEVVLYGSRAKGNYREGSDIDLALKGRSLNSTLLTRIEWDYDRLLLPWKLDLIVYDDIQNKDLKEHIDRVGVVVFSHIPFKNSSTP